MKKEMYLAPELEVLEVMVEQGFNGSFSSGDGGGLDVPSSPSYPF